MKPCRVPYPPPRGFTLVELLVVVAVIAVLLGLAGAGHRHHPPGLALQAAESGVRGALTLARAQAARTQDDALLVVEAGDPENSGSLRVLRVFVRVAQEPDTWERAGRPVELPEGVRLVPPASGPGLGFPADWPAPLYSTLLQPAPAGVPAGWWCLARFTSAGALVGANGGLLVLAAGHRRGDAIAFSLPARALTLSAYGLATEAALIAAAP